MAELRSTIFIDQLQPQTMCYLGTWVRGRLPRTRMAAGVIEIAPGLDIEPLTDVVLKHTEAQAGILVVERQFGYLEFHSRSTAAVQSAREAVLDALGAQAAKAMAPTILAAKLISRLDHQHAFLINRNKLGSMALAGESLFVLEMQPASYAILATNEAEKAAQIKVVDYRMIGATGRVYLTGAEADVRAARRGRDGRSEGRGVTEADRDRGRCARLPARCCASCCPRCSRVSAPAGLTPSSRSCPRPRWRRSCARRPGPHPRPPARSSVTIKPPGSRRLRRPWPQTREPLGEPGPRADARRRRPRPTTRASRR